MRKILLFVVIIMSFNGISTSFAQEIPFTKEDRDRLIRLETKVEEGQKVINKRIDDLREELHALRTFMLWGFGILFGGMGILITVVIWDRRTALSPVIRRQRQMEDTIERVFREYAKVEPKFADVLRSVGF